MRAGSERCEGLETRRTGLGNEQRERREQLEVKQARLTGKNAEKIKRRGQLREKRKYCAPTHQ